MTVVNRKIYSVLSDEELQEKIKGRKVTFYITQLDDSRSQFSFSFENGKVPRSVCREMVSLCGDILVWYYTVTEEMYGSVLVNFRLGGNIK